MDNDRTIAAISTPIGTGGIGIIKISGKDSLSIAKKVVEDKIELIERKMTLCTVQGNDFKDKALVVFFKGPHSYTGEDIVEIHTHGGVFIQKGILQEVINKGAVIATPGEFTKRAFLNSKISLDSAEGIIDMINAESEAEIRAGFGLLKGKLKKEISKTQETLTEGLAYIEARLDYPEDDIPTEHIKDLELKTAGAIKDIEKLLESSKMGRLIKSGINVAILGRPNAGKSSLMNALLDFDRSIVTEIEGTTRDTIEDSYVFKGVKINIIDTAGIREAKDKIEKLGIERTLETIESADIVLVVIDLTKEHYKKERELIDSLNKRKKKNIVVFNKSDQKASFNKDFLKGEQFQSIKISALKLQGIKELKEKIYSKIIDDRIVSSNILITNQRHIESLKKAVKALRGAKKLIVSRESLDLISLDLKTAWEELGKITGVTSTETIIDKIFEKFCLGK